MNPGPCFRICAALLLGAASGTAQANASLTGQTARAEAQFARVLNASLSARNVMPASKPASPAAAGRSNRPLHAVTGVGRGQAGYVHYFLIRLPDDSTEVQLGIELADQRIAWSFPGLGVAVSPFIESGEIEANGQTYEVWHLYGLRPFADAGAMAKLQRELPLRIERWTKAGIPYCLDDAPKLNCMSCLGFVMRALFPGRGDYPAVPRDFSRTANPARYTPNDLLLYLTGMLELPDRAARLQRINARTLPPDLREDLEELVHGMGIDAPVTATAVQKRAGAPRPGTPKRPL